MKFGLSLPAEFFTSNIGPRHTLVIENEFKDLADRQKHMGQVIAKEEWDPWLARWDKVTAGGANEIWNVE